MVIQRASSIKKCDRSLLQSESGITKYDRLLLESASGITKCYMLLLQSASGILNCDSYYKVKRNTTGNILSTKPKHNAWAKLKMTTTKTTTKQIMSLKYLALKLILIFHLSPFVVKLFVGKTHKINFWQRANNFISLSQNMSELIAVTIDFYQKIWNLFMFSWEVCNKKNLFLYDKIIPKGMRSTKVKVTFRWFFMISTDFFSGRNRQLGNCTSKYLMDHFLFWY